jgi:5-methylcytosine-specific restriction endonuclease McrA
VFHKDLSLTFEEFREFTKQSSCVYCEAPVTWSAFIDKQASAAYNLDRKDNALGYTKDNCVVCCKPCNYSKGSRFTHEEFRVMMQARKAYLAKQNFRSQSQGA